MRALILLMILASATTGCVTYDEADRVEGADGRLVIVYRDVEGHGNCAFALYDGYKEGGVAVIGCKPLSP